MVNVMLIDDHPVVRAGLRAILNTFSDVEVVMEGSTGADVDTVSYTHLTLPTTLHECRSRWSPYH